MVTLAFIDDDLLDTRLVDISNPNVVKYRIATRTVCKYGEIVSRRTFISIGEDRVVAQLEWTGELFKSGGLVKLYEQDPIQFFRLFELLVEEYVSSSSIAIFSSCV